MEEGEGKNILFCAKERKKGKKNGKEYSISI